MKAVIVIPTYNEAQNIGQLVEEIFEIVKTIPSWEIGILVVDSKSPDKTATVVKKLQKKYSNLHLLETAKEGLGRAYIRGFKYTMENFMPDVLFEMDADLSHDPKKIPDFLKKLEDGADFVIGSRYIKGGSIPKNWGIHRKIFSVIGNLICRLGFMKLKVTDWTSGYRAIKSRVVTDAVPKDKYSGYVFQVAFLDNAIKKAARIEHVPINFVDRLHGKSKINSFQYIVETLFYVVGHSSFIRYGFVGVFGASLDFGISYLFIERFGIHPNFYWFATAVSAEAAIISNFLLNNFWSFAHKKLSGKRNYLYKFFNFNLIAAGALLIQAVGIQTFTHILSPQYWYVYKAVIIVIIVIPYSYILYNRVIWKETARA